MNEPTTQEIPGVLEIDYSRGVIYFHAAEPNERVLPTPLRIQGVEFSRFDGALIDLNVAPPPPPPAGQPPQWAVEAARQCFPYETHEPALAATAQAIADCLPVEVAAAVRLVELMESNEHCVLTRHGRYLNHSLGTWRTWTSGEPSAAFPSLSLALAALTGDAAEETNP